MGVCAAVREMALTIEGAFASSDATVTPAAQAIASMPTWLQLGRLDSWEERVHSVLPAETLHGPMALLAEVFEFGRLNLYGAFQPDETAEEFRRLVKRLAQQGLVLPEHHTVSGW